MMSMINNESLQPLHKNSPTYTPKLFCMENRLYVSNLLNFLEFTYEDRTQHLLLKDQLAFITGADKIPPMGFIHGFK